MATKNPSSTTTGLNTKPSQASQISSHDPGFANNNNVINVSINTGDENGSVDILLDPDTLGNSSVNISLSSEDNSSPKVVVELVPETDQANSRPTRDVSEDQDTSKSISISTTITMVRTVTLYEGTVSKQSVTESQTKTIESTVRLGPEPGMPQVGFFPQF